MKDGIVVLSLFDGMSCGQIALKKLGVKVEKYYASEIDKYAIAVTQHNFPDTVQLGDVTKWQEWDMDWGGIDLVIGGSPCQGLSASGKGEGLEDPRSKLFFDWIDIRNHVQEHNPNLVFLLENVVPRKKEWTDNMTCHVGVEPVKINSSLVSAQSRARLYWTNVNKVEQPEDLGINLDSIIDIDDKDVNKFCISPTHFQGGNLVETLRGKAFSQISPQQIGYIKQNHRGGRVYSTKGKSVSLTSQGGGWGMKTGLYATTTYSRHPHLSGKILDKSLPIESSNWRGLNRNQKQTGIAERIESGEIVIRMLSPLECERLQTVPDTYTLYGNFNGAIKKISNSQRYRMLGNGWTVDVIAHILSFVPQIQNGEWLQ